jgi:acyl carrier protein
VNDKEITEVVRRALSDIAPEADLDRLDPAADLQEAVDLDSMDFLNLVTAVGEATGVDIPERDYPLVATLSGCVAYLAEHR